VTDAAYLDDTIAGDVVPFTAGGGSGVGRLQKAAASAITEKFTDSELSELGARVVEDWQRDKGANAEWRKRVEDALKSAAQEEPEKKSYPWENAANVRYPLLTIASVQFNARAYPAIVRGDEAIKIKTFGRDRDGLKAARAARMAEYLNWKLFYSVEDWETDTDAMLLRLPIAGQHYRKVYHCPLEKRPVIESVSALRLTVPPDARSLKTSPRITHDFDRYPYELQQLMAAGAYRFVELQKEGEDDQGSRLILEQHLYRDFDNDGVDEPYIVTVDEATTEVLRIEEGFDEEDIRQDEGGNVIGIDRWCPFVDYGFIPDPKGRAYSIGFGHLLTPLMEVINTNINQLVDAGTAQVAGGGFISQEVRLQGAGQNGVLRFRPGEYKPVLASAPDLRNAIYERTLPNPSPVLFQLLGMLMDAAKDVASTNDAITGDAARTAPVGTTLALIEQGQQVFNAIYKRVYRGLREEFQLFADCLRRYGDPKEYARFVDVSESPPAGQPSSSPPPGMAPQPDQAAQGLVAQGPQTGEPPQQLITDQQPAPIDAEALFKADFDADDLDIRPVADPSAVTHLQTMAKAQFVLALMPSGQVNPKLAVKYALDAAGVENADELLAMPAQQPDPLMLHQLAQQAELNDAKAQKTRADANLSLSRAAEIAHNNTGAEAGHGARRDDARPRAGGQGGGRDAAVNDA
jgi:chaperonin GroES